MKALLLCAAGQWERNALGRALRRLLEGFSSGALAGDDDSSGEHAGA